MKPIDSLSEDEWLLLVKRAVSMPDAPPQLVRSALEMWRTHRPAAGAQRPRQRWVAVLSFDSWARAPLAAGMRALPSEVRHLLFTAQGRDIDLRIAPSADGFSLSGQLLGPNGAGSVELTWLAGNSEQPVGRAAPLDDLGEFQLDGVGSGTYLLTVRLDADEIALPPIEIGPRANLGGS